MRRFGEPKRPGQTYKRRPGAYVILPKGDQVLLTFQQRPIPEFQLPGGGIDPGETPLRALYREVVEETGWSITRPRRLGAYKRFTYMPEYELWAEKICHIFVAHPVRLLCAPIEPDHTAHWIPTSRISTTLSNHGDCLFAQSFFN